MTYEGEAIARQVEKLILPYPMTILKHMQQKNYKLMGWL
jgi:hypothetical protein